MKLLITLFTLIILFIGCKENTKYSNESYDIDANANISNSIEMSDEKKNKNDVWNTVELWNFKFKIPDNFQLANNLSNDKKKVYLMDEYNLGLTIDVESIPVGYENSKINDIIPNLIDFGNSINFDNKKYFDDFQLINTKHAILGNTESIMVIQSSTKVSGKNIPMSVEAFFVISYPYYFSITFSYPRYSKQVSQIVEEIKKSFGFEIKNNLTNQKSLSEAHIWLTKKLNEKVIDLNDMMENVVTNTFWTHKYKKISIENNSLVFNFQEKYTSVKGFDSSALPQYGSDYYDYEVIIPFDKIDFCSFDENRTYNGKCKFSILTEHNSIIKKNLTTNSKSFTDIFTYAFDCSDDENLGVRLNDAIIFISKNTPTEIKKQKELF